MNDIIKAMVGGYLEVFDAYTLTDDSLIQELADFKARMTAFGASHQDPTAFASQLASSGIQEEYSALVTKVAMAAAGGPTQAGVPEGTEEAQSPAADPPKPSVKAFVEQYRPAYEETLKADYRQRGQEAYRRLLAVADRTDDMLEAQLIMEEEGLLWLIVKEDSLDIFQPILEAMDPLQPESIPMRRQIEAYEEAAGAEELDYRLERLSLENLALVRRAMSRVALVAALSKTAFNYAAAKQNVQNSGGREEKHLRVLVAAHKVLKRLLTLLKEDLGMTVDQLLADEALKIWLLAPRNVDELGRIKKILHPQNLAAIKEILIEEVESGLPLADLLKRAPRQTLWFDLEGTQEAAFDQQAREKAARLADRYTYYRYKDQLQGKL